MARGKKKEDLTLEKKLERALVSVGEQPYEVPGNWCWTKLEAVCNGFQYGYTEKAVYEKVGPKYIRITDIGNGIINDKKAPYCPIDEKAYEAYKIHKDDIFIARMGSVGENGLAFSDLDAVFASYLIRLIPKISAKYLSYYLQSGSYWGQISEKSQGTTRLNVNANVLKRLMFPLPPLAEQQRIVERIESLFAKLDEAKEKLEDSIGICNERRNAILQKAFSGTLTEKWRRDHLNIKNCVIDNIEKYSLNLSKKEKKFIENGQSKLKEITMSSNVCWYQGNVGAVSIVTNGSTPSRKCDNFWNGDIPWVSSGEVRNNVIAYTEERITQEGYDNSSVKLLPIGTVLIAMIGEGKTRGQSAILNIEATTNQNIAAIVVEHGQINSKFLWYWLQKQYKKNREKGAGSGPQALNCQRVRELDFIIPPLEEQNEIVKIIDNLMNKENFIIDLIETTLENIEGIRKSILANAFRGELGTNNPNEESAIELLKTILVET